MLLAIKTILSSNTGLLQDCKIRHQEGVRPHTYSRPLLKGANANSSISNADLFADIFLQYTSFNLFCLYFIVVILN